MDKVKTIIIIYENGDKQFFNNYRAATQQDKQKGKGAALGNDVAMGYEEARAIKEAEPKNYTELKKLYEYYYD